MVAVVVASYNTSYLQELTLIHTDLVRENADCTASSSKKELYHTQT